MSARPKPLAFKEYINPFVEERLANPREVLSLMAAGEKQGVMSRDEVVGNLILLLIAGHQTTINRIANGALPSCAIPTSGNDSDRTFP